MEMSTILFMAVSITHTMNFIFGLHLALYFLPQYCILYIMLQIIKRIITIFRQRYRTLSVPDYILFRRIFARVSLFSFCRFVRCRQVSSLMRENFTSVLMIFLIVFSLTSISPAIFLVDLVGFRRILARTA